MFDLIIIGSGCAGMTAAIYAKRSGLNVLVLESDLPGGQLNHAPEIENYPGFHHITGVDLAFQMFEQVQLLQIDMKTARVTEIQNLKNKKIVLTNQGSYEAKAVIIATGRRAKRLGIDNEEKLTGKGISSCALCDGNLYKNKSVAIIGSGVSTVEETLFLSEIAKKVVLVNRGNRLIANEALKKELNSKANVEVLMNYEPTQFIEKDNYLSGVILEEKTTKKIKTLDIDGAFVFVGFEPSGDFVENLGITEKNYIVVNENMETAVEGIFACGDVIKKRLYQIVTATSEGAIAATNAKKYIKKKDSNK